MKSLRQLAYEIGASYRGQDQPFRGLCFDTRLLEPGNLFAAIKGERDGHGFIPRALEKGAGALLVSHPQADCPVPQIIVADTLIAMGKLAKAWKEQFSPQVIALTGSCGKTTTKEMLSAVFARAGPTAASPGNYNNALGVPVTLCQLDGTQNYLIVEMGTNSKGEIPYLVPLVHADVGLITNIGASHTEGLESLDGIMEEKGALLSHLDRDGTAVINLDDPRISRYARRLSCRQISYSCLSDRADVTLQTRPVTRGTTQQFTVCAGGKELPITLALFGRHQLGNALATIATALACQVPYEAIQAGLANLKAPAGRAACQAVNNRLTLVDDTYNASFPSVIAAINSLQDFPGRRILVLTTMGELGEDAPYYHSEVNKTLQHACVDAVLLYGDSRLMAFLSADTPPRITAYTDKEALWQALQPMLASPDAPATMVLVKGARAFAMEEISNRIRTLGDRRD